LETGRRNQIRVHFAEAGHPVLGDERYGRELGLTAAWSPRRLALHAQSLGFTHPESGQLLEFTCPLPPEMKEFRNRQERGTGRRRDT
jgi:23S rRNA pseudouridine1911/1915/1917 synthase